MTLALALFVSLSITLGAIPLLGKAASYLHVMDMPDERKIHTRPIPKIGGIAMAAGFFVPVVLWLPMDTFVSALLAGCAILVVAGILDDVYNLNYKLKFLAQITAAVIVMTRTDMEIVSLGMLLPPDVSLPWVISKALTILVIVGITNAINLADGLDGLAGGVTMITFVYLCALGYQASDYTVVFVSLVMFGVLFAFLNYNTYPATVFMGDAGSQMLGFISIVLSLKITQGSNAYSPLLPLLIVGFPLIDTLVVMLERARAKRPLFKADNNHLHHKLLRLGFYHSEAVFLIYVLQTLLVTSAYFLRYYSDWVITAIFVVLSGSIAGFFHYAHRVDFVLKRSFQPLKDRLKRFKDTETVFWVVSIPVRVLFPALLVANGFMVQRLPSGLAWAALGMAGAIVVTSLSRFGKKDLLLRLVLYFSIPAVVYFRQESGILADDPQYNGIYPVLLVACMISALVVARMDRPQGGFRLSPMDYLIVLLAVVTPGLLGQFVDTKVLRIFLAQVIIFFYCFEVMLHEHRRTFQKTVAASAVGMLVVVAMKGLM